MKRTILAAAAWLTLCVPNAAGQQATAGYTGEVIVTGDGKAVAPWVERELCRRTTAKCEIALINAETNEIAMMGGILGTDFERTQNGREIRRAETALAKAVRLRAATNQ